VATTQPHVDKPFRIRSPRSSRRPAGDIGEATSDGLHLTAMSDPIVAQGSRGSMVLHMTRGGEDRIDPHIFDLVRVNGRLKIQSVSIMATPNPVTPL